MPTVYKIITALMAIVGSAGLGLTGQLNPLMLIPGLAIFPGYYRYLKGMPHASKSAVNMLSVAVLALFVFDIKYVTGDFFLAVAHLTVIFQALKSYDLKEPWDNMHVFFMALLQLIIASELETSEIFGIIFLVFLFLMVAALTLSHFIKARSLGSLNPWKPIYILTLSVVAVSVFFFIAIPRMSQGVIGAHNTRGIQATGFTERIEFGTFGQLILDSTMVMRVELSGPSLPLYWRGVALDRFNGLEWSNTAGRKWAMGRNGDTYTISSPTGTVTTQKFYVEPMDSEVLFGLGAINEVETEGKILLRDGFDAIYLPLKRNRRTSYTVISSGGVPQGSLKMERYLQLPAGVERISRLASDVSLSGKTQNEKAALIERYLKTNFTYSLNVTAPPQGLNPIEDFIFNTKAGYCEHYATAMVMMLRSVSVPSRIVAGFYGGEISGDGNYVIVRRSNAHTWVEAMVDGAWGRFDPTPQGTTGSNIETLPLYLEAIRIWWYRHVVGFTSDSQVKIIKDVSMPFRIGEWPELPKANIAYIVYAIAVVSIIFAVISLRGKLWPQTLRPETKLYLRFRKHMKKSGVVVKDSTTPKDLLEETIRLGMDGQTIEFISIYEELRFGGRPTDAKALDECRMLLERIVEGDKSG